MSGPGFGDVEDVPEEWKVVSTVRHFSARVITGVTDAVVMPDGEVVDRDYVVHPGSVAVVALDDQERVLLLRQYRHPARRLLWELPAGLRDVEGEPLHLGAARELAEETGHRAGIWHTLVDTFVSPGMSDERTRIFLARDVSPIPAGELDFVRRHEEADMPVVWVPLTEAVRRALGGMIHNSQAVTGILAAYAASADGFASLRPADAPEA
ncbi:NUDIX hydrolase [Planomonospora parontospora subsp. parontospora]|uniref:NUDIX hydrolase n=2 Tax=Planomonospora parontospora TaxID=58119 RepID=A0AA37BBV0_9ACTN|nr:NUDIX hydrolase [Planomonospora parontospora]GGK48770.1 NUDIX hydrolase [Planomonospora parontospora]GII06740.1 NUDIX hydrolase [Planomonospora parontospora subsp. parontospora]